ncbi:calcium/sodium antiporter [Euzebya tangerina]|uniref:calcium/sodium antiporter n=1 Tax=Euzebya tangerina TaxID=591198 RepID=UPI000E31B7D8|nr:calcium/sodium antiporter [Euzebya tangerina]
MRDALLLVAGLGLLTYAADKFVLGAVRVATILRVSIVLVGALVVGFGTSAPELLVSALASIDGKQDIALGNIVGSNVANVMLVIGSAALFGVLPITTRIWRQEIRLMLIAIGVLALVSYDLRVSTIDAIFLLVGAVAAIGLIIYWASKDREAAQEIQVEVGELSEGEHRLGPSIVLTLVGLAGTLAGAQMLVVGASGLAEALGLSEAVIGLTVVAIGTSLPELVTAVAAARRQENDLIIGNVVGSNIFNSLPVAGVAGILDTTPLDSQFGLSLLLMVGGCVLFAVFSRTDFFVNRWEGGVLLAGYAGVTALAL